MSLALRGLIVITGLVFAWYVLVLLTSADPYILPDPGRVAVAFYSRAGEIFEHAVLTATEILAGLAIGCLVGTTSALTMAYFRPARRWLMPVLVISQAVPVFALAPILVLWLGYGMASKIAMAVLIIYFPVTAAFYDGLRRTEPGWLELARVMNGSAMMILRIIRLPAALPALASGIRVAAATAPIGAVVGEWVGSSGGLGYLMLHANARLQIDVMFAALFTLAVMAVGLYYATDLLLRRCIYWQQDTFQDEI